MMLCTKIEKEDLADFVSVAGDQWIAEEKFDGDRIQAVRGQLINRRGANVTIKYPEVFTFLEKVKELNAVFDGEMCVLDENGLSQFNEGIAFRTHCASESSINASMKKYPITYVIFDILELDGENLREHMWIDRRKILDSLDLEEKFVMVSHYTKEIQEKWDNVTAIGGEGIILKKISAPYYENKRSSVWKKVKDIKEVDLTFTKFRTNPKGIRIETEEGIGCQVAGYHAPPVQLEIETRGKAEITIRHLGKTKAGVYRQPTFKGLVEV